MIGAILSSEYEEFADTLPERRERASRTMRQLLDRVRVLAAEPSGEIADRIEGEVVALLQALDESEAKLRALLSDLFDARLNLEAGAIQLRELFEMAPCGYIVTDDQTKIIAVNVAATEILGQSANALVGKPLVAQVALDERDGFRQAVRRVADSDAIESWPVRMTPPRGQVTECSVRVRRARSGSSTQLYWLMLEESRAEDLF